MSSAAGVPTPADSWATASPSPSAPPSSRASPAIERRRPKKIPSASLSMMRDPAEQTLTAVQSPLSPGEQRDRAVLLVVGSADAPALPARTRLQITGDDLFVGRRAEGVPAGANAAVLDDGLVSSQHARITRVVGGYDLEDLGSKNGTWVDNLRLEGGKDGKVRLRDGALIFFGNHVAVFRMVSQIELDAIKAELVAPL